MRGFRAGSLNVVVREVGISKGSLFQCFEAKLDLWITVCEMGTAEINGHLFAALPNPLETPLFELLHQAMAVYIKHLLENERSRRGGTAVWLETDRLARRSAQRIISHSWETSILLSRRHDRSCVPAIRGRRPDPLLRQSHRARELMRPSR